MLLSGRITDQDRDFLDIFHENELKTQVRGKGSPGIAFKFKILWISGLPDMQKEDHALEFSGI